MKIMFGLKLAFLISAVGSYASQKKVVWDAKIQTVQSNVEGADQIMFQLLGTATGTPNEGCNTANKKLYIKRSTVGTDRYRELLSVLLTAQTTGSSIIAESAIDGTEACNDINSIGLY